MDKKEFAAIGPAVFQYFSAREISGWEKAVVVILVAAYIFSPVDLIPDVIPVVGWLDDIGVGSLFLAYCGHRMKRVNELREQRKNQEFSPQQQQAEVISVEKEKIEDAPQSLFQSKK